MARYFFNFVVPAVQLSRAAGILPALSMSRSENPTNRQQDVNSKKRRESQHSSRTSESSHTMSDPENEIVAVFSCRSDDPIRIDHAESTEASFHTRDDVNVIADVKRRRQGLQRDGDTSGPNYRSKVNKRPIINPRW